MGTDSVVFMTTGISMSSLDTDERRLSMDRMTWVTPADDLFLPLARGLTFFGSDVVTGVSSVVTEKKREDEVN